MESTPLVSIITPVHNGAAYLDDLIVSVRDQDYPFIEHIILDDGSNDNDATIAILKKYSHLRWWSRENRGQYATMNEGLEAAKGDIVCFVSADDMLTPFAISNVVQGFLTNTKLDGIAGNVFYMNEDATPFLPTPPFRNAPRLFYPFYAHIAHCSLYLKKQSLIEHNLFFDSRLKYVGDYDWILHILKEHLVIKKIDPALSKIRIHAKQTSQISQANMQAEKILVARKYGTNKFLYQVLTALFIFSNGINKSVLVFQTAGVRGFFRFFTERINLRFLRRFFNWLKI